MHKVFGPMLVGVGVFLLVLSALFHFWAPDRAKKTPLNLDVKTVATGSAKLSAGNGEYSTVQLRATRHVRVDSAASDSDDVVVNESVCIVKVVGDTPECVAANDPQNRLVSFTTDRVAANRHSALSVNDAKYHEAVNSDTSVKHKGLSYKWPFDAKKKSYAFFDPNSLQAPEAKYMRTEKLKGIDSYVYKAVETDLSVPVAAGVPGRYSDTRTVWIDPVTGTILKGVEQQTRSLANGEVVLDTTLTFDDATVKYQVGQAKDGRTKLSLVTVWIPLIGLLGGLASLVGAFLLLRRRDGEIGRHNQPVPVGAGDDVGSAPANQPPVNHDGMTTPFRRHEAPTSPLPREQRGGAGADDGTDRGFRPE